METHVANFQGKPISFLKLPGNGLLLRTTDFCGVLGIIERPAGTALSKPCLDLASAVSLSMADNPDFAMWLNETFVGYNFETLVHPGCDDAWNFS